MKRFKILLIFLFTVLYALCGCKESDGFDPDETKNNEKTVTTAVIEISGKRTSVGLEEGSIITFTDDYMIIKTNGEETALPLNELSKFSYQTK